MFIYLDNNATTAVDSRVFQAMCKDLCGPPLNPSSLHTYGQKARAYLVDSRRTVADFFQVDPSEVIFTSGGTEGINTLLGVPTGHLVTTYLEHSAVYECVKEKWKTTYVPVGAWGAPTLEQVQEAVRPDTRAIILSAANGETGVKLDVKAVAAFAKSQDIPLYLDAVAWIGKEAPPLFPGVSALVFSGHKFHAPKGVGGLILRKNVLCPSLIYGGPQEHHKRGGTENLPGILGLAAAVCILQEEQNAITERVRLLRDTLEEGLLREIPDVSINGEGPRIANVTNLAFHGVDGESLLMRLDLEGVGASHGSACSSGAIEPSRVLREMGFDRKRARSSLRFSLSRENTIEEVGCAVEKIAHVVKHLR